jgi:hypothetical protein
MISSVVMVLAALGVERSQLTSPQAMLIRMNAEAAR